MKKLILAASILALLPATAQAQLLGGGGLGGTIGGTLDTTTRGTIGSTIDGTSRTVRSTVDSTVNGTASTQGSQSVDARRGTVSADRSANGSLTGSTASLADLVVPPTGGMAQASGSGSASGQGSASAQLIGTDTLTSAIAPTTQGAQGLALNAAGIANGTASGMIAAAPMPGMPTLPGLPALPVSGSASASASREANGAADGNGSASLVNPLLAAAGSSAAAGQWVTSVAPGMPVMTADGAALGKVREVVANGRGEIEQVVVKQGEITRTLPAGMFSASGNALLAGSASGNAVAKSAERPPVESAANE